MLKTLLFSLTALSFAAPAVSIAANRRSSTRRGNRRAIAPE
jgi:hypothetical protein